MDKLLIFLEIIGWLICFAGLSILLDIWFMLNEYKKYCKELVNKYFNENLSYEEFEIIRQKYLNQYIEEYKATYDKDDDKDDDIDNVHYVLNTFFDKIALRIIKFSDSKLSTEDFVIKYIA